MPGANATVEVCHWHNYYEIVCFFIESYVFIDLMHIRINRLSQS